MFSFILQILSFKRNNFRIFQTHAVAYFFVWLCLSSKFFQEFLLNFSELNSIFTILFPILGKEKSFSSFTLSFPFLFPTWAASQCPPDRLDPCHTIMTAEEGLDMVIGVRVVVAHGSLPACGGFPLFCSKLKQVFQVLFHIRKY